MSPCKKKEREKEREREKGENRDRYTRIVEKNKKMIVTNVLFFSGMIIIMPKKYHYPLVLFSSRFCDRVSVMCCIYIYMLYIYIYVVQRDCDFYSLLLGFTWDI